MDRWTERWIDTKRHKKQRDKWIERQKMKKENHLVQRRASLSVQLNLMTETLLTCNFEKTDPKAKIINYTDEVLCMQKKLRKQAITE